MGFIRNARERDQPTCAKRHRLQRRRVSFTVLGKVGNDAGEVWPALTRGPTSSRVSSSASNIVQRPTSPELSIGHSRRGRGCLNSDRPTWLARRAKYCREGMRKCRSARAGDNAREEAEARQAGENGRLPRPGRRSHRFWCLFDNPIT